MPEKETPETPDAPLNVVEQEDSAAKSERAEPGERTDDPVRARGRAVRRPSPFHADTSFALSGEPVTKRALETLRLGEPPLGNLTWDEQNWLGSAMAHLMHIYQKRAMGEPYNSCHCIFCFPGHIYVQFLAPFDKELLLCEAVSATFSQAAAALTLQRENLLLDFDFAPPAVSPNYSQRIYIRDIADLGYAARLAFRVLKEVYLVARFEFGTFKLRIPGEMS
jgi:hypothetical protein